ncbi:UDP-N-acetylmuramoyl-L-alanyl-D-glutamate--2,6-diaminopimelate ligase [Candidatus Synechococcus calcipolaris G9]|uniref:UDP-N-acetylmuramoyl-L-alanyl-D-glutamate--2,6-diaminopimelate ligase n=1 Tax=Candidatus Synechococcus calcipolaris G9 TaxID=1497997 RepID=A0ABT6EUR6_9SYNE|nr:UDP-N-acetylmuramoyl-L-alanyl-D-glutamate--2,6-diaminopimelate ligase [Candidatus Synechococcus calcipolaris]MDG2989595.1 UDP-N-acetylmuramoyl-L-alanyl-D-glutamate--2,6-diaminopimelate ligase [Candidatus Synechococcus calcipolaris G9]
MKLRELLEAANLSPEIDDCDLERDVTHLSTNSWDCRPGTLFMGMPGSRVDGGNFWPSALAAGAVAALISPTAKQPTPGDRASGDNVCVIPVANIQRACGAIAAAFYDYPAQHLALVGVTGTNGKTTTTHLIEFLLSQVGYPTALLGTLYSRWPGHEEVASHTTPFAVDLQARLGAARSAGCRFGVMEVSSHALDQDRVWGCTFETAVFTNLTQDHLDYHPTMEDYFAAKAKLFSGDYLKGRAIANVDDPYGQKLLANMKPEQAWGYSTETSADFYTTDLVYRVDGVAGTVHTPTGVAEFNSPLVGQFNVANLLAAIAVGIDLGLPLDGMVKALADFPGVPGRMQQIRVQPDQDISVIVDYAHTPDSLDNLLRAARPFIQGEMICVFGCGGDRDRSKRPQMGAIAAQRADQVVVTSDNPRTEDPRRILEDILTGIPETTPKIVNGDRREAIHAAILQAKPGDGVIIAGKGHEDYQILGTEKVHFDDREEAMAALRKRLSSMGNSVS